MSAQDKLKELRSQGITVWSISRLNSFYNCEYEYYNTYIKKNPRKGNVYTEMGSFAHDFIEGVYKNEKDKLDFSKQFEEKAIELDFLGIDFPSEQIRQNFIADIKHYTDNFKLLDGKHLLEKLVVFDIDGNHFQGYIDMIHVDDDKNINIIDWKSSSKFTGDKLKDAGRQLIMYKLALESNGKTKINSLKWCMLKYLYVCHVQKNGKTKYKMASRRKWVKEMENPFKKEMISSGMDDLEISILMEEAIETNSIDNLPQFIRDKYWIEDCYVEYVVDDEKIIEFKDYVNNTIKAIESKDSSDESQWKPLDLEKDSFYCNFLCNSRDTCKFLKEYKAKYNNDSGTFNKPKTTTEISLDDLFN